MTSTGMENLTDVLEKFDDLDILLFQGELRGRVSIQRCEYPITECGVVRASQSVWDEKGHHVIIEWSCVLSCDCPFMGTHKIMGALLHQMLHAYFAVLTGEALGKGEYATKLDACHSPLWQDAARRVSETLGLPYLGSDAVVHFLQHKSEPVDEIALLQDIHVDEGHCAWRPMMRAITLADAHAGLLRFLGRSVTLAQHEAQQRILRAISSCGVKAGHSVLLAGFNDLDNLLFGGVLRYRVHVHWVLPPDRKTQAISMYPHSGNNDSARIRK